MFSLAASRFKYQMFYFLKNLDFSVFPTEPEVLAALGLHSHRAIITWSPRRRPLSHEAGVLGMTPVPTVPYCLAPGLGGACWSSGPDSNLAPERRPLSSPGPAARGREALPTAAGSPRRQPLFFSILPCECGAPADRMFHPCGCLVFCDRH